MLCSDSPTLVQEMLTLTHNVEWIRDRSLTLALMAHHATGREGLG
jgi:hypothetical protein